MMPRVPLERSNPIAAERLAAAPISWGVCEVPGWGLQLDPERVLSEMGSLGLTATELGAIGYLPTDAGKLRETLDRHGLQLVGGFVPLVLHEHDASAAHAQAEEIAALLAAAGAGTFVAAIVTDYDWAPPIELDDAAWERLTKHLHEIAERVAAHGLTLALHPHAGTLIETAGDVERALQSTDVGWCLDTGHLLIAGVDPADFVRDHGERIVHVHLKDVDAALAQRFRSGELTLVAATQHGLFRPLGQGDAEIAQVTALLDANGYEGWLVLEQDTAITGVEPPAGSGPIVDVQQCIEFLTKPAPPRERVIGS